MPVPASGLSYGYVKPTETVFELEALEGLPCGCVAAAYRARQLANGASHLVEEHRDKPTVVALREISEGKIGLEILSRAQL